MTDQLSLFGSNDASKKETRASPSREGEPLASRLRPRALDEVVGLATAPKSNALYQAYGHIQQDVQETRNDPVPLHLRNAPTRLMKALDYGKDYQYAHERYKEMQVDDPERPPSTQLQDYLPENVKGRLYYQPGSQGKEASIGKWLQRRREGK